MKRGLQKIHQQQEQEQRNLEITTVHIATARPRTVKRTAAPSAATQRPKKTKTSNPESISVSSFEKSFSTGASSKSVSLSMLRQHQQSHQSVANHAALSSIILDESTSESTSLNLSMENGEDDSVNMADEEHEELDEVEVHEDNLGITDQVILEEREDFQVQEYSSGQADQAILALSHQCEEVAASNNKAAKLALENIEEEFKSARPSSTMKTYASKIRKYEV